MQTIQKWKIVEISMSFRIRLLSHSKNRMHQDGFFCPLRYTNGALRMEGAPHLFVRYIRFAFF